MLPKTTRDQDKDTGLLLGLIVVVVSFSRHQQALLQPAMLILLVTLLGPGLFRPLARLWFGLAHLLGNLSSKVVLTTVFFVVVTPVALLRRLAGKDAMRRKEWKGPGTTAMIERNHRYAASDLEHPY